MAPTTDQDGRGREDVPWMQPAIGDISTSDIVINTYTTQPAVGLSWAPRVNSINSSLEPSRSALPGRTADVPRGNFAIHQIQALGIPFLQADRHSELQQLLRNSIHARESQQSGSENVAQPNIGLQQLQNDDTSHVEVNHEEPNYVMHSGPSPPAKRARKIVGPSPQEWEARKDDIYHLYIERNYYCREVVAEMAAEKGFNANEAMYKRKFEKWGWKTYEPTRSSGRPTGQISIRRAGRRSQGRTPASSPITVRNEASNSSNSRDSTVTVFSPPSFNPAHFNPVRFTLGIPAVVGQNNFDKLLSTMLFNVKDLYLSHIHQKKWSVANPYDVEEDEHDDLLVKVGTSLRNYNSLTPEIASMGMQKAFQTLGKVVGVKEGADPGLFSLPAIWESFLRMLKVKRSDLAGSFLERALHLAKQKFGNTHSFVQALRSLQQIQMWDPERLKEVVTTAYQSCIDHVKKALPAFHLTSLALWADFVVYLDSSSTSDRRAVVNDLRQVILKSEYDNGRAHDHTLKLLGLTLYVLQTPLMTAEAEKIALDMLERVEQRVQGGEELKGELLIIWKDLRHTLGQFCHARGDDNMAISHLEAYVELEDMDDRYTFALDNLEEWYTFMGKCDDAERIRQRRMEILLVQNDAETTEEERGEYAPKDMDQGSSEATAVDMVEESDNGAIEEENIIGFGDSEAEIENVQQQIRELKQRLNTLQGNVRKSKGKNKTS